MASTTPVYTSTSLLNLTSKELCQRKHLTHRDVIYVKSCKNLVHRPYHVFVQMLTFTHINIIIAKLRNTTLKTLQKSSSLTLQPDGTSDALSVFRYLLLEEPNERYFQCWSCLDLRMKLWNIRKCVQCTALSQKISYLYNEGEAFLFVPYHQFDFYSF